MDKLGTIIHGIGASEHLDSSGERISVEGVDISSLPVDGLINFEHKSEAPSQFIGKIIEATKIFKKEDCKNENHEKFWDKAGKTPYIYIKAVLFDKFGHQGANDAVAMLKFDEALGDAEGDKGVRQVCGFSVEGSRLAKEGSLIKKCIARKMSFTAYPCNKACVAEILVEKEEAKTDGKILTYKDLIPYKDLERAFKKSQEMEMNLAKAEKPVYENRTGGTTKSVKNYTKRSINSGEHREGTPHVPNKTYKPDQVKPSTSMVGNRIDYSGKPKARSGASIYKDPKTWKAEVDCMSNSRKAQIKKMKKNTSTQNIKTTVMMSEKKMKRKEILKSLSQEAFDLFPHKEELLASVKKSMPEGTSEKEIVAVAKTYAYVHQKKEEIKLAEMANESSLNDE